MHTKFLGRQTPAAMVQLQLWCAPLIIGGRLHGTHRVASKLGSNPGAHFAHCMALSADPSSDRSTVRGDTVLRMKQRYG